MKRFMKFLAARVSLRALLLAFGLYLVLPISAFAMFQLTNEDGAPIDVPYILFIPYVLGVVAHWYKNWEAQKVTLSFVQYLITNGFATALSLILGLGGLTSLYAAAGHSGLFPVTITSWETVFMFAIAADTINSGFTKSAPSLPPAATK